MTGPVTQPLTAGAMTRRGPFARFFWAAAISSTGDWITVFAMLALADSIGGEGGILVTLMARIVPGLALGAVAGVITDRMDRRKLVVIADVGRGLVIPSLALVRTLPTLVAITILLELLSLLGQPPRTAMVPRLVAAENLVTANSLMLGAAYGTVPFGAGFNFLLASLPAVTLGGLLPTVTQGLALAFFVDSATFFISGLLVATLPRIESPLAVQPSNGVDLRASWRDFVDGTRFLMQEARVRRVIIGMATALFGGGTVIVLGKAFAEDVLGAGQAAFFGLITALGVGAGAGIVLVSFYEHRIIHRDLVFGLALLGTGTGLAAAAVVNTVAAAFAWMLLFGFGAGAGYVMAMTHLHEGVGDEMRGRVFATLFALMRIGLFVSMAIAVPLGGAFRNVHLGRLNGPSRWVLFLGGLTIVASGAIIVWTLRHLLHIPELGREAREIMAEADRARRGQIGRQGEGARSQDGEGDDGG
jgi:dTMP kinase